jgi:serine O-acetyltransferase
MIYVNDLKRYMEITKKNITTLNLLLCFFSIRMLPVLIIRISLFFASVNFNILSKLFSLINVILFGIECSTKTVIGPGLFIPHSFGIVIGAYSIGDNATIYQGVTIGAKELDFTNQSSSRPIIGDNVTIASGAKVLGGINIGDNVVIAANAVVINDVTSMTTVGGVPAIIIKHR